MLGKRPSLAVVASGRPAAELLSLPPLSAAAGWPLGIALFTVAGEDVTVGGCEPHASRAAQSHGLQLGSLWPAAVAGGSERLFKDSTEGHHWLRA